MLAYKTGLSEACLRVKPSDIDCCILIPVCCMLANQVGTHASCDTPSCDCSHAAAALADKLLWRHRSQRSKVFSPIQEATHKCIKSSDTLSKNLHLNKKLPDLAENTQLLTQLWSVLGFCLVWFRCKESSTSWQNPQWHPACLRAHKPIVWNPRIDHAFELHTQLSWS